MNFEDDFDELTPRDLEADWDYTPSTLDDLYAPLAILGMALATAISVGTNLRALIGTEEFYKMNLPKQEIRELVKEDFGKDLLGKVFYVASTPGRESRLLFYDEPKLEKK